MRPLVDVAATGICWLGHGAARAGSMGFARQLFGFAHRLSPRHAWALRYLAWCLRETGDLSGAIEYYKQLLKLDPSFVEGRVELGFVFGSLERYPEALEQLQRALDHSPRDWHARGGVATMLICINHFAEAIPVCEDLVRDDPGDVVVWGFLGRARAGTGQWDDALAAYETAQGLRSDPQVAAEHASVLMELARYVEAEAVLKGALAKHVGDRTLRAQLASAFVEQRRYVDAENVLQDILREDPVNPHARHVLATLLADTARTSEAAGIAEGLRKDCPDDAAAHAKAGWVALKAGCSQDALTAYEHALQIEPGRNAFMAGRATALKQLGRRSAAEALMTAIVERDPSFFVRHAEWTELMKP